MSKLKSRKLWLTIGTVAGTVALALTGNVQWPDAIHTIVAAVGAYALAQGHEDASVKAAKVAAGQTVSGG